MYTNRDLWLDYLARADFGLGLVMLAALGVSFALAFVRFLRPEWAGRMRLVLLALAAISMIVMVLGKNA